MSTTAKNFDILATDLSVLHNYFDSSIKLLFWSVSIWNFRSFSKTVLFAYKNSIYLSTKTVSQDIPINLFNKKVNNYELYLLL